MNSHKKRVAILISGRGSNMVALIEAAKDDGYPVTIVTVISNRADAAGLALAESHGIPTRVIAHKSFPDRTSHDAAINASLEAAQTDIVCLAGYMRLMSPELVNKWMGRMINIHPSLLPAFPGLHTHDRAIAANVPEHGCTVHFVTPGMDEGPAIARAKVQVWPSDTAETLSARVLVAEHQLYPAALRLVAEGTIYMEDGRVVITH